MRIGVDVGGTKIEAVRVDDEGTIVAQKRVPTEAHRPAAEIVANITAAIRAVWSDGVRGIGVAVPGFTQNGLLVFAPNVPNLVGFALPGELSRLFSVPVDCENDANCFALAEHHLGAGKGTRHMVGVIFGTGVGGGVIVDGRLIRGASGAGGEIGHMRVLDGSSWEDHLSGPALKRKYMDLGGSDARPHPSEIWKSSEKAAVLARAHYLQCAGLFLASLINAFNPEAIVVGGGLSNLPFYDDITAATKVSAIPQSFAACRILRHEIGDSAGSLGAAMLIE